MCVCKPVELALNKLQIEVLAVTVGIAITSYLILLKFFSYFFYISPKLLKKSILHYLTLHINSLKSRANITKKRNLYIAFFHPVFSLLVIVGKLQSLNRHF